jgi:hypothetical protein
VKKDIDMVTVVMFLIAVASFLAAAKGHGGQTGYGFFSGG